MAEIIAVVGATASGKSSLAIEIAQAIGNAEIINADAMQLYRGMDIGTAKLTQEQMQGIRHHLLSVVEPTVDLTAVEYRAMFDRALEQIQAQGKTAIVVGGSTLYLASALDNLEFAPTDPQLRSELEMESERVGALTMHQRLAQLDPIAAQKIPAANKRRVIRALEVVTISGKSFASSLPTPSFRRPTIQLAIDVPRELLIQRIEKRVNLMWEQGLLAEVEGLLQQHGKLSATAAVAIGYQQAIAQLHGELTQAQAIAETIFLTQRYAKKQRTWFNRDQRINWLNPQKSLLEQALELIRL
ncbi:MAG: tRNA ((37)-N6)-dimethylallyltransferase MiaA [Actinomycetota bacterium]